MHLFAIYFSMLAFLFTELICLVMGVSIGRLLLMSVGIFFATLLLGRILCDIFAGTDTKPVTAKGKDQEKPKPEEALKKEASPTQPKGSFISTLSNEEIVKVIKENPKETARVVEALISQ